MLQMYWVDGKLLKGVTSFYRNSKRQNVTGFSLSKVWNVAVIVQYPCGWSFERGESDV